MSGFVRAPCPGTEERGETKAGVRVVPQKDEAGNWATGSTNLGKLLFA